MIQLVYRDIRTGLNRKVNCVDKDTAIKITKELKIHNFVLKGGFVHETPVHEIFDERIRYFSLKSI